MNSQLRTPPQIEPTREWIAQRRAHLVREIEATRAHHPGSRRSPSWRLLVLAAALALLVTGVALAASGVNPLEWLRSGSPGEVRFSIDTTRTVSWAAPSHLRCAEPGGGEFTCSPAGLGRWVYDFYQRVEAQPALTRESALAALAASEARGTLSRARADRIRAQIAAVGDDFFLKLNVLLRLNSIGAAQEARPGLLLVPPDDVPQIVTCQPADERFDCRKLGAAVVPVGAPIYGLRRSTQWVEKPYHPAGPEDFAALIDGVFGRTLTAAEQRLLLTMGEIASESETTTPRPQPEPATTGPGP